MKPLILGEAPSHTGDKYWIFPMSGLISQRFCEWAGIPPQDEGTRYGRYYWALREKFDLQNLLEHWPGPGWPKEQVLPARDDLLPELDGRVVVLAGRRLADTFGLGMADRHAFVPRHGATMAWIYHPSGRTRQYNDLAERVRAGHTLKRAMELASAPVPE